MLTDSRVVALYLCLSPSADATDPQLRGLEMFIKQLGERHEWYQDQLQGDPEARPARARLLDDVRAGKVKLLVVWRLDRLGVSMDSFASLCGLLRRHQTGLISVTEQFDLARAETTAVVEAMESIARADRALRVDQIKAGIARAKKQGKRWGGSPRGRAYRCSPEKKELILRLYREGRPIARIARRVRLSRTTVYAVLYRAGLRRRRRRRDCA